jgi:hypothetical protein
MIPRFSQLWEFWQDDTPFLCLCPRITPLVYLSKWSHSHLWLPLGQHNLFQFLLRFSGLDLCVVDLSDLSWPNRVTILRCLFYTDEYEESAWPFELTWLVSMDDQTMRASELDYLSLIGWTLQLSKSATHDAPLAFDCLTSLSHQVIQFQSMMLLWRTLHHFS